MAGGGAAARTSRVLRVNNIIVTPTTGSTPITSPIIGGPHSHHITRPVLCSSHDRNVLDLPGWLHSRPISQEDSLARPTSSKNWRRQTTNDGARLARLACAGVACSHAPAAGADAQALLAWTA